MIPAPRPIIKPTPSSTAIPQENSYANLTTITLLDYHAIRENHTCVVPTVNQCLQDLYKRVSPTDATPQNTSLACRSYNATAKPNETATELSVDDIVIFSFLLVIAATAILTGIIAFMNACFCAKGRKKRREDIQRQAREEPGLEIGNIDAAEDSDADENENQTIAEAPPSPRSSLWKFISTRKTSPGSSRRSSASTGRSRSRVSHPYTPRIETFAVPTQAGRRPPSVLDGAEGLPLPPPVYEMAHLDPMHKEDVGEAPTYL